MCKNIGYQKVFFFLQIRIMVKVTVFRSLMHWVPLLTRHRCGIYFLCLAILVLLLYMTGIFSTSRMHHLRLALRDNRVLCVLVHNRCQLQNYSLQKINLWRKTFSASAVKLLSLSLIVFYFRLCSYFITELVCKHRIWRCRIAFIYVHCI